MMRGMKGKHAVLGIGLIFLLTGGGILLMLLGGDSSKRVTQYPAVRPIEVHQLPDPDSSGAQLLATRCVECHAMPDPASHTAENWPAVLRRMSGLSAARFMPALTAGQAQTLEAYLRTHARQQNAAVE